MTVDQMVEQGLVAIIRAESVPVAVERGHRLAEEGVRVLEVTFTLPTAAEAIRELASDLPGVQVGAGTVRTVKQAEDAVGAGAVFLVSPHYGREVGKLARSLDVPYLPACFTSSELACLLDDGYRVVKLFPAVAYGPDGMRALGDPFPEARFVPTGGIRPDQVGNWLRAGAAAIGMGAALTAAADARAVARRVLDEVAQIRGKSGR